MPSILNPYISFKDNAKEAMEFYKSVFGGTLTMSTFKEGGAPVGPADENKIMHSMLIVNNGMTLMGSDTPPTMKRTVGDNISLSLSGEDEKELKGYWDKLSEGANTSMPLSKAPWGDMFGMLIDKFGIPWLVNVNAKKS
jgi:PhnB protein